MGSHQLRFRGGMVPLWLFLCPFIRCKTSVAQVLDQSYDPTGHITVSDGFGGFNSNQEYAQTFRAGLSGTVTRVDVFVKRVTGTAGSMILEVRAGLDNGFPDGAISPEGVLGTATLPSTSVPTTSGFVSFVLNNPAPVTLGDLFAIDLHVSSSAGTFSWFGSQNDPYPAGNEYEREVGNHGWFDIGTAVQGDLGFRTFVNVPEAGCFGVLTLVAATLLSRHRARQF